jgi:hypothetical protein
LGAVLFDMPDTDALPAGVLAVACSMQAHRLGINPGGEMRVYARDESEREKLTPFLNRLLTEGEGLELGLFTYKAGGAA